MAERVEENMTSACLIIDDPRLCPKYGCLNYSDLLNQMKNRNFFSEIAFIPFNYRFSNKRTVKLFSENPDYFGICIHGFDHLGNEFGITDYNYLRKMTDTSLWRMEEFKNRTGLSYDRVIVFPQGKFSSVAMKALKDSGYIAAFNSTTMATDTGEIPSKELEKIFTDTYDLPLFLRRYPSNRDGILEDFKNGRPIILVEHHAAFKNNQIFETIDWVNSLGNIEWKSLRGICLENKLNQPSCSPGKNCKSSFKSMARRVACEIRDNYFQTNPVLNKLYSAVKGG
jgi:hypothetical protein